MSDPAFSAVSEIHQIQDTSIQKAFYAAIALHGHLLKHNDMSNTREKLQSSINSHQQLYFHHQQFGGMKSFAHGHTGAETCYRPFWFITTHPLFLSLHQCSVPSLVQADGSAQELKKKSQCLPYYSLALELTSLAMLAQGKTNKTFSCSSFSSAYLDHSGFMWDSYPVGAI